MSEEDYICLWLVHCILKCNSFVYISAKNLISYLLRLLKSTHYNNMLYKNVKILNLHWLPNFQFKFS